MTQTTYMPNVEFYGGDEQRLLMDGYCPDCVAAKRPMTQMEDEDTGKILARKCRHPDCGTIWVLAWKGGDIPTVLGGELGT